MLFCPLALRANVVGSLLGAAGLAACTPAEPPGELIGVYDVASRLSENSCGPTAVIAGDTDYSIELRRDQETAYWQLLDSQPVTGRFHGDATLSIHVQSYIRLYDASYLEEMRLDDPLDFVSFTPGQSPPAKGCTLVQTEELSAELDPAADHDAGVTEEVDLVGTHQLHLTAESGSDCSAALQHGGGPFEALPCDIHYALTARKRAEP